MKSFPRALAGFGLGLLASILGGLAGANGAERIFDFNQETTQETPRGFRSVVTGGGAPGDWRIVRDEVPSAFQALAPGSTAVNRVSVLAQLSQDSTDERFPLLIFDGEEFADFTFTARFKTIRGAREQMAGLAFRIQDPTNYYVLRASSLGRSFRFYKFVNAVRSPPIGPEVDIPAGVWHEMAVTCKGNSIRCRLNGQELIPPLTDNTFTQGKIGFWTKSDAVSHFVDAKIEYTPLEMLATVLVREALQRYPRVKALRLYATTTQRQDLHVVAASDPADLGKAGTNLERQVIEKNSFAYGKESKRGIVLVTLPLHDRNGDAIAAARIEMDSFPGQTEQNAIARALPIVKRMEVHVRSARDLTP
jgi:hypothetical protein